MRCSSFFFPKKFFVKKNQTLLGQCRPITTAIRSWFQRIKSLQPNPFYVYIFMDQGLVVIIIIIIIIIIGHFKESPMKQLFLSSPTFWALLSHSQELPELAVPALAAATMILVLCWKQGQSWIANFHPIKLVWKHLFLTVDPSTKKTLELLIYLQKDLLGHWHDFCCPLTMRTPWAELILPQLFQTSEMCLWDSEGGW